MERGADPLRALDHGAARARQHGRAEAVGVVAAVSGGLLWGEIFAEAGLPAGVLNIVTHAPGEAPGIGDELVESPHVRRLNFTGSTRDGPPAGGGCRPPAEAGRARARRLQPADRARRRRPRVRGRRAAFGAFLHQGQICMSTRRIIVERSIADEFTERLVAKTNGLKVGDPKEHDTIIGPLINAAGALEMAARVEDAVDRGAKVLVGGERRRALLPRRRCSRTCRPTPSSRGTRRSARSPRSRSWTDAEQAVERANATSYGLSAGIITRRHRAWLRAGAGGSSRASSTSTTRRSATSRRCRSAASRTRVRAASAARAAVDEFTELRWVTVQAGSRPVPLLSAARPASRRQERA